MRITHSIGMCALGLLLTACESVQPTSTTDDPLGEASSELGPVAPLLNATPAVVWGDAEIDQANPHLIDPCFFVRTDVLALAQHRPNLGVMVTLSYVRADGHHVTRSVWSALSSWPVINDPAMAPNPDAAHYSQVGRSLDPGGHFMPAAGTYIDGSVRTSEFWIGEHPLGGHAHGGDEGNQGDDGQGNGG